MNTTILLIGILIVTFVGFNIGGSCIGPAFGPAIGANAVRKITAAVLMSVFFFVGAWTIGRRVVDTLGKELLKNPEIFTLEASLAVLLFIGLALFLGNYFGVPASTSMTAVGSIAGLGIANNSLNWTLVGEIFIWWIISPAIGFWVSLIIGRYFYTYLNRIISLDEIEGSVVRMDDRYGIPLPLPHPDASRREYVGVSTVVVIGCLMAFSSGTSNIANAIAPLVGSNALSMNPGILLGAGAVTIGTFTIGRRTLETLGNDLTELPLTAAVVVATVSASLVIVLSAMGIPASFVVIATVCIVGLGWGRATRPVTLYGAFSGAETGKISINSLTMDREGEYLPEIGEETAEELTEASSLFEPGTTGRVILLQNFVPIIATIISLIFFNYLT